MKRPFAEVIGDPISHSRSPLIYGFWLEKLNVEAEYQACHVVPKDLSDYFSARRCDPDWRGCNITIPHKQAALDHVDTLSPEAMRVGAINTVWRDADGALFGTNTDLDGVEAAIGSSLSGKAVVIGAGGAARAAFALLSDYALLAVTVMARSQEKAARAAVECGLDATFVPFEPGTGALADAVLVINATQLGMTGQDAMPDFLLSEVAGMAPGALVFDMVYAPLQTALLKAAQEAGLITADGLVMLVGQAASAFERFFGATAPRQYDQELRRILTR